MRQYLFALMLAVSFGAEPVASQVETASAADAAALIQQAAQRIAEGSQAEVAGVSIAAGRFIADFYAQRDGRPAWVAPEAARALLAEIDQAVHQGFRPGDFHLPVLFGLFESAGSGAPADVAAFDIVATDAAARLVQYLIFGKVDPRSLDRNWNFDRPVLEQNPAEVMNAYLDGAGFGALMTEIAIDNPEYLLIVDALSLYREIAERGGWGTIADGQALKPEMEDDRVPALRTRLAGEGDYLDEGAEGNAYDLALVAAVESFQRRHGLTADGVVGPRTLAALNAPVEDRIDKLRLSLERYRWYARELEDDYVLVNIGGARTFLVLDGQIAWITRSITGSEYRQTPVFRDEIEYMEFNPTWTVPHSIFLSDKLPKIRQDPGYLERNDYVVRNRSGQVIPASSVNWSAANPPVSLMQKPGPNNALGMVKFMFPNEHSVYLHDTDNRALFDRDERNLSSGCVRIEDPFVLAGLLMAEDTDWSQNRMQQILDSGKTTRVTLPRPMPVLLTYWTAWVEDGVVQFREDPYDRDPPVLKALNAEF